MIVAFIVDIGDRVSLRDQSILDLGGGFRVEGPDSGRVIDISVGMDLVAVEWDRAQFRGWYDVETLSRVVSVNEPAIQPQETQRLSQEEMLRFASIQDLLRRLGFVEDQQHACLRHPHNAHSVNFDQIAGRSLAAFVQQGLNVGWLREYVRESSPSV